MSKKILWVDVETGGLDHRSGNVLQIGAILTDENLNEIDSFSSYCKPINPSQVNAGALKVNNLTFDQIRKFDDSKVVQKKFFEFINKNEFILDFGAYNANFDFKFIIHWLAKNNLHTEFVKKVNPFNHIDPLLLARKLRDNQTLKTKNAKLETLANHFKVKLGDSHDAVVDIKETILVYKKLIEINDDNNYKEADMFSNENEDKKEMTYDEKHRLYINSKYISMQDNELYIKETAFKNKDALKFIIMYVEIMNFSTDHSYKLNC